MKYWTEYKGHKKHNFRNKSKNTDSNIYTFDTESTSVCLCDNEVYNASEYERLTEEGKEVKVYAFMYIWMFGINDEVYYGRTSTELKRFLDKVFYNDTKRNFVVYCHNLPHDFDFIRDIIKVDKVFAREARKPITITSKNITFKCSYSLTGAKLEDLPYLYGLPVKKQTGSLDYDKIRHKNTKMTDIELKYCEYDCLVLYHLIKKFLETYETFKEIPLTKTGIVRKKVKAAMELAPEFYDACRRITNTDPEMHRIFQIIFAGGYTHANALNAGIIHKNVRSFDFNSSYPFVMTAEKCFPVERFRRIKLKDPNKLKPDYVYLLKLKFTEIEASKFNTIISFSRAIQPKGEILDNGRIVKAEELTLYITNYDYDSITQFYTFKRVEVLEAYTAKRGYMPRPYIEYVLTVYKDKTTLKGVAGREEEYSRAKSDFNSLFGMSVTNNIRETIEYINNEWIAKQPTYNDVKSQLIKESKKAFLAFALGIFITAKARHNLLTIVSKLDEYVIYCDTDSAKLREGFDINIIIEYNKSVQETIKQAEKELNLTGYTQTDQKGNTHTLGIFEEEFDNFGKEFITLGAKKYAYTDKDNNIHITVAGVPKKNGVKCLKSLEDFRDGFIFKGSITGKLMSLYSDETDINMTVTDYNGDTEDIYFNYGHGLVPCSYLLKQESGLEDVDEYNPQFKLMMRAAI